MGAPDLAPARIGQCRCGEPVFCLPGKQALTIRGNLVCDSCLAAICDEQPLGPGKAIPNFSEPTGR